MRARRRTRPRPAPCASSARVSWPPCWGRRAHRRRAERGRSRGRSGPARRLRGRDAASGRAPARRRLAGRRVRGGAGPPGAGAGHRPGQPSRVRSARGGARPARPAAGRGGAVPGGRCRAAVAPPPGRGPALPRSGRSAAGRARGGRLRWELHLRGSLQLSADPLFPIEQFVLGGITTVRGYREYLSATDNAFAGTVELRVPVARLPVPYVSNTPGAGTLQLVPFFDRGAGWNTGRPTPPHSHLSSVGVGLRWLIGSGTLA